MNWKRISLVERHDEFIGKDRDVDELRCFSVKDFREKDFAVHGGRDYHMDLGMFFQFLQEHKLEAIFPVLFGVEGKSASK